MEFDVIHSIVYENLNKVLDVPSCTTVDNIKSFVTIKATNYIPSKRITIKTKNQSRKIKENCIEPYRGEAIGSHSLSIKNIWAFDTKIKPGFVDSSTTYRIDDTFKKIPCTSCNGAGEFTCDECNGKTRVLCYDCGGSGFINCEHCDGEGRVECRECRGEKKIKCSDCNGNGEIRCPECRTRGKIRCPKCNGHPVIKYSGNTNKPDFRCSYCRETGEIVCPTCHGKEYIRCNSCDGVGYNPCKACGQTGKVDCDYCNGEGRFECTSCDNNNMVVCNTCRGNGTLGCATCERQGSLLQYSNFTENIKIFTDVKTLHSKGLPEELVINVEKNFIPISEKTFDNNPKAIDDAFSNFPQVIKDLSQKIFSKYETASSKNLQFKIAEESVDVYQITLTFKEKDFIVYIYSNKNLFYASPADLNFITKELWKDFAESEFNNKNTINAYYAYNYLTKFSHDNFPNEENLFKIIKDGISSGCKDKLLKQQIKYVDKGCSFNELEEFIKNGSKEKFSLFSKKNKNNIADDSTSIVVSKENVKNESNPVDCLSQNISKKSRLLAFFICLFLGFFGIHNFYIGKYKKGILHLALFVSGILIVTITSSENAVAGFIYIICIVMAIIDLLKILFGKAKDGKKLYIKKWIH